MAASRHWRQRMAGLVGSLSFNNPGPPQCSLVRKMCMRDGSEQSHETFAKYESLKHVYFEDAGRLTAANRALFCNMLDLLPALVSLEFSYNTSALREAVLSSISENKVSFGQSLQMLSMSWDDVSATAYALLFRAIQALPTLRHLSLEDSCLAYANDISDSDFADQPHDYRVQYLRARCDGLNFISVTDTFPRLHAFSYTGTLITRRCIDSLRIAMDQLDQLKSLCIDVAVNGYVGAGMELFASSSSQLTSLELGFSRRFMGSGAAGHSKPPWHASESSLNAMLQNNMRSLQILQLNGALPRGTLVQRLLGMNNLRTLRVMHVPVTQWDMQLLVYAIMPRLEELDLHPYKRYGSNGIIQPYIDWLALQGSGAQPGQGQQSAAGAATSRLRNLRISIEGACPAAVTSVLRQPIASGLESLMLSLSSSADMPETAAVLTTQAFAHMPRLTHLDVSFACSDMVSSDDVSWIPGLANLASLRELHVFGVNTQQKLRIIHVGCLKLRLPFDQISVVDTSRADIDPPHAARADDFDLCAHSSPSSS